MSAPVMAFQKAAKRQSFLRLALEGPAGYGKTYTALEIATRLAPGKVAFLDTEAGSASKYADLFDFDVIEIEPPFHPARAVAVVEAAEGMGYGVVILDSLSHFWTGAGGLLELVDEIARTKYRGDSHRAWKEAGDIQQALVDAILRSKLHVIAAMRTKADYVRETITDKDGREKTKIRKAGTKTIQRDEFDYEFDIIGRFDVPTIMAITKSRCAALPPETIIEKPGADFTETLTAWLGSGESFAEQEQAAAAAAAEAEAARAAHISAQEIELHKLVGKLGGELDPVKAAVNGKRAEPDFVEWLDRQVAKAAASVKAKANEFKVPAGAQAETAPTTEPPAETAAVPEPEPVPA